MHVAGLVGPSFVDQDEIEVNHEQNSKIQPQIRFEDK